MHILTIPLEVLVVFPTNKTIQNGALFVLFTVIPILDGIEVKILVIRTLGAQILGVDDSS